MTDFADYIDVSQVITNYSAAGIPLETMWTDIGESMHGKYCSAASLRSNVVVVDYMDRRRVFTVDPQYFPLNRVREIVDYLHARDQKYSKLTCSMPSPEDTDTEWIRSPHD